MIGIDGADATRHAIGAADGHPLSDRRIAPAIQRLQRTVVPASKLACPPAADPQPRYVEPTCIDGDVLDPPMHGRVVAGGGNPSTGVDD